MAANGDAKTNPAFYKQPVTQLSNFIGQWVEIYNDNPHYNLTDRRNTTLSVLPPLKFPCLMQIVDYDYSNIVTQNIRLKCWLLENEVNMSTVQSYFNPSFANMELTWVKRWVTFDQNWTFKFVDESELSSHPSADFIRQKGEIYRICGDRQVEYGDGGQSDLVYPIWINERLSFPEHRRQRLTRRLLELNEQRQDFHPEPSPVEDIIDPDLLACRPMNTRSWTERHLKELEEQKNTWPYERDFRCFKRDLAQGEYDQLSDAIKLRETYQWLPSEFIIKKDGKIDICSPIYQLPVISENKQTYGDIATIFSKMLPMFEKMKLITLGGSGEEETKLQVIVKAQSYNLKPGMIRTEKFRSVVSGNVSIEKRNLERAV
ncbi:unnamed protein product [Didymodactylos carnosus]|uniref:DUF4246 domain-containing protein n=1 Tax=Didymodactylos carnosus TaxID=1234261 RepID=A0A814PDA9_9BILA|nr:unnamed protein product [Didymodactylos carnosus]CAF1546019.1 unnamed protein product [Didymodactylos carnosus]CAF3871006.1 unnamed protein product [Didymodactylos carnosus]CAF4335011.1 unnamed protein product [Didymodactylos carnosus]